MTVLDASAILAFLRREPGVDVVRSALDQGEVFIGAANWSETAQKVTAAGADWALARALLLSFDVVVEPVTVGDAEAAALLWRAGSGLSLGDRLCLALGTRLDAEVLTADTAWGEGDRIRQVR